MTFLKEKINEIKIALFRTEEINSELKLPNNIITTLKVDDDGTVWFLTATKEYYEIVRLIDKPFFAYLDYYRKGIDCHLRLSGKATIVHDTDEAFGINCGADHTGIVLVKMKIMQAEFYEKRGLTNLSWSQKIRSAFNHLFIPHHRVYNFS